MKFQALFEILKSRMAGADFLPVFLLTILVLVILSVLLVRYGTGFLLALAFMLTGLLLINSNAVAGLVLIARFPLVIILVLYSMLGRKNRLSFSKTTFLLMLLPLVMLLNSVQSWNRMGAIGQSLLFLLFYMGLIFGGQRILGDVRGRSVFINAIAAFVIIISCLQVPFLASSGGRLTGIFQTTVGYMIIGMPGVVILFWFGIKQKVWSRLFVFFMFFAAFAFILIILTGGRAAVIGTLFGVLVLMVRRLKRNVLVVIATCILFGPIGLKAVTSFPGFENVKAKLFSTKDTRSYLWTQGWAIAKENPWLGHGTGASSSTQANAEGLTYHQAYLELSIDHGFLFAGAMMFVFFWLPIRGLLLMRKCQTEEMKDTANLSAALLTAYVLHSMVASDLFTTTGILPAYSFIALQEGVRAENREIELYGSDQYYDEDDLYYQTSQETQLGEYVNGEQV